MMRPVSFFIAIFASSILVAMSAPADAPINPGIQIEGRDEDSCGYVNLSRQTGDVKNQNPVGNCYAFTAVELMNFGTEKKERVSAIATSIQYGDWIQKQGNQSKTSSGLDGGWTADAINAANSEGACREKDVESYDDSDSKALTEIKKMFESSMDRDECPANESKEFKTINKSSKEIFRGLTKSYFFRPGKTKREFAQRNWEIFNDVMNDSKIASKDRFNEYMRSLVKEACKKTTRGLPHWAKGTPEDVKASQRPKTFYQDAFNYINDGLDQGKPTGVGYYPHYEDSGFITKAAAIGFVNHASLVAGRKYVSSRNKEKQGCYLLVKNSWGEEWPGERLKGLDAQPATDNYGVPIPGYFQVKDTVFSKYIKSFTNLGNDPKVPLTLKTN